MWKKNIKLRKGFGNCLYNAKSLKFITCMLQLFRFCMEERDLFIYNLIIPSIGKPSFLPWSTLFG